MVRIKSNTFTITPVTPVIDGTTKLTTGWADGTPITVKGNAQQLSPSQSFDSFGESVDNGWAFYLDTGNESSCMVGGKVTFGGITYAIQKVQVNNQGLPTDHIALYAMLIKNQ